MFEPIPAATRKAVAKALVDAGVITVGGAEIWARSGFHCDYCGDDLLVSPQSYGLAEADHILPVSRYPKLKDDLNNYAHTCGLCNKLKRNWDPGEMQREHFAEADSLTEDQREQLIRKTREHLASKVAQKRTDIGTISAILRQHGLRG